MACRWCAAYCLCTVEIPPPGLTCRNERIGSKISAFRCLLTALHAVARRYLCVVRTVLYMIKNATSRTKKGAWTNNEPCFHRRMAFLGRPRGFLRHEEAVWQILFYYVRHNSCVPVFCPGCDIDTIAVAEISTLTALLCSAMMQTYSSQGKANTGAGGLLPSNQQLTTNVCSPHQVLRGKQR